MMIYKFWFRSCRRVTRATKATRVCHNTNAFFEIIGIIINTNTVWTTWATKATRVRYNILLII